MRTARLAAAITLLVVMVSGIVAPTEVSAHAGNLATTLVHACIDNTTAAVRIVGRTVECGAGETATHWVNLARFKQMESDLETLQAVVDARADEVNNLESTVAALQATVAVLQDALGTHLASLAILLNHVKVQDGAINGVTGPHVIVEGANLHVRSGSGQTEDATSLGNLFIGYNEPRLTNGAPDLTIRDGSHNLVVGPEHRYSASGGFVAGVKNTVSGDSGSVAGGQGNVASGLAASVGGGANNKGTGQTSSVSGGLNRTSSGPNDWRAGSLFENQ